LIFQHNHICLALLLFIFSTVQSEENTTALSQSSSQIEQDTTRIHLLFEKGNQYIDGPSDSLLHYYRQALQIIRNNIEHLQKEGQTDINLFTTYQYLEVRALIEFGIEYFYQSEYDTALFYYFEAQAIVESLDDIGLLSECYSEIGIVYKNQGKFDLALEYYSKAIDYAKQIYDTLWVASCKVNIGNIYKEKGYLTIALNYYLEALKILERNGNDRRIAVCYQNIGDIYNKQLDYNKALEYYSRSLTLAKNANDKVRENTCYLNIGYVYANLNEYTMARDFYDMALELYKESGYTHELDDCYILIGDSYRLEENYQEAIPYYNKALKISNAEQDQTRHAETLIKLGNIYKNKNELSKALSLSQQSLEIAEKIGSLGLIIEANGTLSEIYEAIGWHQKAFDQFKIFSRLKDSLFNTEKYKAITEMEVKYESEKKEQQLALLEEKNQVQMLELSRRNRFYIVSMVGIGLILLMVYILFRNHRLKTRHRAIELEQKLMRSQMNPHFIFNSLIAIQSYIYKNEAVQAGDYLAKFADLIRITLENSRVEFVVLEKELKMLNVYIELQALRFDNKFDFQIKMDDDIDPSMVMIPPMMAQPFIENAIEHGLRHKKERGKLIIEFKKTQESISCLVEDNGIGRAKSLEFQKKKMHQSMATSITRERLVILSKKARQTFNLEIIDLEDENNIAAGTRVKFNIPYQLNENVNL